MSGEPCSYSCSSSRLLGSLSSPLPQLPLWTLLSVVPEPPVTLCTGSPYASSALESYRNCSFLPYLRWSHSPSILLSDATAWFSVPLPPTPSSAQRPQAPSWQFLAYLWSATLPASMVLPGCPAVNRVAPAAIWDLRPPPPDMPGNAWALWCGAGALISHMQAGLTVTPCAVFLQSLHGALTSHILIWGWSEWVWASPGGAQGVPSLAHISKDAGSMRGCGARGQGSALRPQDSCTDPRTPN